MIRMCCFIILLHVPLSPFFSFSADSLSRWAEVRVSGSPHVALRPRTNALIPGTIVVILAAP